MENASKALIIAGAVLISILLIAFGVAMINAAQAPIDRSTESTAQQEAQIFNAKFSSYAGTRVSGSNVRSLLGIINTNNAQSSNPITVTLNGTAIDDDKVGAQIGGIVSTKTYNVSFGYDGETGFINTATITVN